MTKCNFCSKEITKHEAGRGTDKCIAEKLGWSLVAYTYTRASAILTGLDPATNKRIVVPHYSEDLNEAVKLWNDGWYFYRIGDFYFIARFIDHWALTKAPTLALAIARAFLTLEKLEEGK